MDLTLACAALKTERDNPDLRVLAQVAGDVEWIEETAMATTARMLVVTGQWAIRSKGAGNLFTTRSSAAKHTLVVPKFRPGDWANILKTPTKVEAVQGEFHSFDWGSRHHAVPGFIAFRTALHAAKWAAAPGVGTVILGYRPQTAAGVVVLCSAVLTARVAGLSLAVQQGLYRQILEAASLPVLSNDVSIEAEPARSPATLDEFLEQEHEIGAAVLLGCLLTTEEIPATIDSAAFDQLGIRLDAAAVAHLVNRLPKGATKAEICDVLRRHGWGAYLRRLTSAVQRRLTWTTGDSHERSGF